MKFIKYITLSGLIGVALWSCKDDDFGPLVHLNSIPTITAPTAGAHWLLLEADADFNIPDVIWTAADYGFNAGTRYKLEMDVAGKNFAEPVTLGNVNALSLSGVSVGDFNNILLAKELEGETPVDIDLRVTASINSDVAALVSEVVTITVTPYSSTVVIPQLQVPGSYQGWDPANNSTVIFSPKSNGLYEGYLDIDEENAKFKYTLGPSWDTNWGDTDDNGSLDQNGTDIAAGAAGIYKLNVDITGLTHARLLTSWGLIGSATSTGWDSDLDMTYDPGTGKISITTDLVAGDIKFRANDGWDINFGDDGNNKTLEYGTANIPVAEAGNYTIDLLIVGVPKYKYAIKKN